MKKFVIIDIYTFNVNFTLTIMLISVCTLQCPPVLEQNCVIVFHLHDITSIIHAILTHLLRNKFFYRLIVQTKKLSAMLCTDGCLQNKKVIFDLA